MPHTTPFIETSRRYLFTTRRERGALLLRRSLIVAAGLALLFIWWLSLRWSFSL